MKEELNNLDKKRLEIRNNYKKHMIEKAAIETCENEDYILFPKSVISKSNDQLKYGISWLANGFVVKIDSNYIAVDPSVNFMLRLTESDFDITKINYIFISHKHLDHSSDADALMDLLLRARKNVKIIAPKTVFDNKVISDFHSGIKPEFKVNHSAVAIDETSELILNNNCKMTFVKLIHSVECFGFKIESTNKKICYLSDTSYSTKLFDFKEKKEININEIKDFNENVWSIDANHYIKDFVTDSNILIANIDSFMYTKNSKTHLPLLDLVEIVKNSEVEKVVLAHINPEGELTYEDWGKKLAEYFVLETGIKTFGIIQDVNKIII